MGFPLIHEVIPVGLLQCNCSILGDPSTREGIVVDPGDDVDLVLEVLRRNDLKVGAIVSTHTHIDHVGGLALLQRATGAPVLIHEADLELYRHLDTQAQWLGVATPAMTDIHNFLKEGDTLRWGSYAANVLHTPGHTPGSLSLLVDSGLVEPEGPGKRRDHGHDRPPLRLLSGDTLFRGSIGRTDLWGGSYSQILDSIRAKLMALPDEVVVYPGHGESTTIGYERENNPFIR
jgi:hydroxyacylglutathione hydrolase